ncbi:hypothetical protein FCI23_54240, partial [Actinacidiphila oryziradicis]
MPDTMHEDLFKSARRWAQTALDAYTDPADHDFAVHHMAVADEHLSKSYLSSITEVLLVPDRPSIDDLLVLGGHEGKAGKGRAGLRTIGGAEAVARAEKVLGKPEPVNVIKAGRWFYPCAGIVCSSGRGWSGLLIQAAPGSLGGSG